MRSVAAGAILFPPFFFPRPFYWGGWGGLLFVVAVVVLLLLFVIVFECCLKHLENIFRSNDIYRPNSNVVFFSVKNATFIADFEKNKIKFKVKIKSEGTDAV